MKGFLTPRLVSAFVAIVFCLATVSRADDYANIRVAYTALNTGGPSLNLSDSDIAARVATLQTTAQGYLDTMQTGPSRTCLWNIPYYNTLSAAEDIKNSMARLAIIAQACKTSGVTLTSSNPGGVAAQIIDGVAWLYENYYNESTPVNSTTQDWFNWEIGIPQAITVIETLLYTECGAASVAVPASPSSNQTLLLGLSTTIDHVLPDPTVRTGFPTIVETGSNLTTKLYITVLNGGITGNGTKVGQAITDFAATLDYQAPGTDGYRRDGSFVAHTLFDYTNGYGLDNFTAVTNLLAVVQDTAWRANISAANLQMFCQTVHDTYEPATVGGWAQPSFCGRNINFGGTPYATVAAANILRLAQFETAVDSWQAASLLESTSLLVQAMQVTYPTVVPKTFPLDLISAGNGLSTTTYQPTTIFPQFRGDRFVVHYPGYAATIAMYSSRMADYESFLGKNFQGWHMADGMLYLFNGDQTQYGPAFWKSADMNRLGGTTVLSQTPGPQKTQTFKPLADSTIQGGTSAGIGLGTDTTLAIRATNSANYERKALIRFALNSSGYNNTLTSSQVVPSGLLVGQNKTSSIVKATLRVYGGIAGTGSAHATVDCTGYTTPDPTVGDPDAFDSTAWTGGWTEGNGTAATGTQMCWNYYTTLPNNETTVQGTSPSVAQGAGWYEFDVTEFLRYRQASGARATFTATFVLADHDPLDNQYISFNSLQASSNRPQLIVTYNLDGQVSDATWVGGTELSHTIGAAGMQLHPAGRTLKAKKSWFTFPDKVVALGSDIQSSENLPVETVVLDQYLASSANTVSVNGGGAPANGSLSGVQTLYVAGNASGTSMGVYFPTASAVESLQATFSNPADSLYFARPPTAVQAGTRQWFWINHAAVNPANAQYEITASTYAYVLLPNITPTALSSYNSAPDITVVENDANASAVYNTALSVLAANVWNSSGQTVTYTPVSGPSLSVQTSAACSLIVRTGSDAKSSPSTGVLELSLADPTQAGSGTPITVTLNRATTAVLWHDAEVTVTAQSPSSTTLSADVSALHGRTVNIRLATSTPGSYVATNGAGLAVPLQGKLTRGYERGRTTTVEFDVTPVASTTSGAVGFADNDMAVSTYDQLGVMIKLVGGSSAGKFWPRNGAAYVDSTITYQAGQTYHLKIVADNLAQTFNAWITSPGGSPVQVATNDPYRTNPTTATGPTMDKLGQLSVSYVTGSAGLSVSNVTVVYAMQSGIQ